MNLGSSKDPFDASLKGEAETKLRVSGDPSAVIAESHPTFLSQTPAVGSKIGKYQLTEKLGAGGIGVVFKARDLALDRAVAIKLLLPQSGARPIDTMRFQQEARAASKLEHHNIVKIHDFNITEDGIPFLVMSYLDGIALSEYVAKQGALPLEHWLPVMMQAAQALRHAHENGIIHRDIKPSNFVLSNEKGEEVLKLVDFGIAKIESADGQNLTKTGDVFGSPLYMSPEQCAGKKVDARSDIYSLGCVMYETISGKPPLMGENSLATIMRHLQDKPEPLQKICPNVKNISAINNIVMRCLEKDPAARYADASALCLELETLFKGEKLSRKPWSARKKIAVAVSVFMIIALPVAVMVQKKIIHDQDQAKLAKWRIEKAQETELKTAQAQKDIVSFQQDGLAALKHWDSAEAVKCFERSLKIADTYPVSPGFRALLLAGLGRAELQQSNQGRATELFTEVINTQGTSNDTDMNLAKYYAYTERGQQSKLSDSKNSDAVKTTQQYFQDALTYAQLLQENHFVAATLHELGNCADQLNQPVETEKYLKKALELKPHDEKIAGDLEGFWRRHGKTTEAAQLQQTILTTKETDAAKALRREKEKEEKQKRNADKLERSSIKAEQLKDAWSGVLTPDPTPESSK